MKFSWLMSRERFLKCKERVWGVDPIHEAVFVKAWEREFNSLGSCKSQPCLPVVQVMGKQGQKEWTVRLTEFMCSVFSERSCLQYQGGPKWKKTFDIGFCSHTCVQTHTNTHTRWEKYCVYVSNSYIGYEMKYELSV